MKIVKIETAWSLEKDGWIIRFSFDNYHKMISFRIPEDISLEDLKKGMFFLNTA